MQHTAPGRFRATIHYDGSDFAGWQVQPSVRTVQGEFEAALGRLGVETRVNAAGRTDAGVHAAGQEVSFDAAPPWISDELARALQAVLPDDIWIEALSEADRDFHPRFQATARRYEYYLAHGEARHAPYRRRGIARIPASPDPVRLRGASRAILGRHDFSGFSKSGQPDGSPVCTVEKAEWTPTPLGDLRFTVVADRFLHRMVRYLVAAMIEQAEGTRPEGHMSSVLRGEGGGRPPSPAPGRGLYLTGVRYREGWNRAPGVPGLWPAYGREWHR